MKQKFRSLITRTRTITEHVVLYSYVDNEKAAWSDAQTQSQNIRPIEWVRDLETIAPFSIAHSEALI